MEKKDIKKLKHYDNVVEIGRKRYCKEYIEYARGYLGAFEYIIISERLGLKHTRCFPDTRSEMLGYRKGYADLMTWRAEAKNKKKD